MKINKETQRDVNAIIEESKDITQELKKQTQEDKFNLKIPDLVLLMNDIDIPFIDKNNAIMKIYIILYSLVIL